MKLNFLFQLKRAFLFVTILKQILFLQVPSVPDDGGREIAVRRRRDLRLLGERDDLGAGLHLVRKVPAAGRNRSQRALIFHFCFFFVVRLFNFTFHECVCFIVTNNILGFKNAKSSSIVGYRIPCFKINYMKKI